VIEIVKRRVARRIGWALAGVLLLTVVHGSAAAAARPSCERARLLLHAGLLNAAAAEYHAVARRAHGRAVPDACVVTGLRRVRDARTRRVTALADADDAGRLSDETIGRLTTAVRLASTADLVSRVMARELRSRGGDNGIEIAEVLHDAGYDADAKAVVRATLQSFPLIDVPPQLRGLGDAGLDIAAARALSRAGFDDAAFAELQKALEIDPTVPVPTELVQDNHRLSWWHSWRGSIGPWIRSILEILLLLAIAVAIVVVLARLYGRITSNRLSIKSFIARDASHGSSTATSVRENYVRMSRSDGHRGLKHLDSGPEAFDGLPAELTDVATQVRLVDAVLRLVDRLTSRWIWQLKGELRPPHPTRGVGLWLSLSKGRKESEEVTIWEEDFWPREVSREVTQESYDRLTVPAAAWLLYTAAGRSEGWRQRLLRRVRAIPRQVRALPRELKTLPRRVKTLSRQRRRKSETPFKALGTADWCSYALSEVGSDLQARGDPERARRCFERALGLDPHNRCALLSLAAADAQESVRREQYRDALKSFERLIGKERRSNRKLWYSARYGYAIALLRPADDEHAADRHRLARRWAVDVCATIAATLQTIDSKRSRKLMLSRKRWEQEQDMQLKVFLDRVQPLALLVLASALYQEGAPVPAAERNWDPSRAIGRRELDRRLRVAQEAGTVPAGITHEDVARHVQDRHDLRSDAHYNLACYHVRIGNLRHAQEALHSALKRGEAGLRRQVRDDPALASYRKRITYRWKLNSLLKQLERRPTGQSGPARSRGVGLR
jgi:tetratricopeptide (TPR) repeat protein